MISPWIPGKFHGQIYSYPERRWKKKKHYFLFNEEKPSKAADIETGEAGELGLYFCLFVLWINVPFNKWSCPGQAET